MPATFFLIGIGIVVLGLRVTGMAGCFGDRIGILFFPPGADLFRTGKTCEQFVSLAPPVGISFRDQNQPSLFGLPEQLGALRQERLVLANGAVVEASLLGY